MNNCPNTALRTRAGAARRALLPAFALLLIVSLVAPLAAYASNPATGALSPLSPGLSWTGTALGTGSADGEATCIDGVNCDSFTLTVAGTPADWANSVIRVDLNWTIPVDDYDLYIHKGDNSGLLVGTSGGGAPSTNEAAVIDPSRTGTGVYTIHAVYFTTASAADEYKGSAVVMARPNDGTRSAIYLKDGFGFCANQTVKCPVTVSDGEPSSRTDIQGNHYVAGIRGVPAGVDLWWFDLNPSSSTFDPFMRNPQYRGQPDSFTGSDSTSVGADGGGDVDLAVGWQPDGPNNVPRLAFSSLTAANVSTSVSTDLGKTWTKNPAGNVSGGAPVDDRQWMEFYGKNTVYLLYRTLDPAITQIQRSTDGGLTFGPAQTAGQIGQVGSCDVDQNDGTVYVSGSSGAVAVGVPASPGAEPTNYNVYQVANNGFGVANIFVVVRVAADGTAYVAFSNGYDVFLKHSKDKGKTWSKPVKVDNGLDTTTSVLPCLETGPTPGSVLVGWYGSTDSSNDLTAKWKVFLAQSLNATDDVPTFRQTVVSDHYIHGGVISIGGLLGGENRNLLDYFQVSYDPQGAAVVDYTDDHNDLNGNVFVTRQISGPTVLDKKKMKKQQEGPALPAAQGFSNDGSQVTDFVGDVTKGLLVTVPDRNDLDVVSIKYGSESDSTGQQLLTASMKVSDLSTITPLSNWRMDFTANAPATGLNASGMYSNGLSDFGDLFYVKAYTDSKGTQVFVFGTGVRNRDGSMTYTQQGTCTGSFDQANNTVTVKVPLSALNAFVSHGAPIASGSVLCGLRGEAYTSGQSFIIEDIARGGLEFKVP